METIKTFEKQFETCPECGSENLQNIEGYFEDGGYSQHVWCEDCGQKWWEIYTFSKTEVYKDE